MKHFKGSFLFTVIGLVLAYLWVQKTAPGHELASLFVVIVLGILEVSLSFDNAVVNAMKLEKMPPIWQHRFLTWGILIAVFGAVISGFGFGLVFKSGFTTGGMDILKQIFSKYLKISIGNATIFTDGIVITLGLFVFGIEQFMYSLITVYVIGIITDKVILGISNSKAFHIITNKEEEIKKYLIDNLNCGVTVLDVKGGYTNNRQKMLMCIIPTKEYFKVKEGISNIDSNAFFLVTDAYEVSGGFVKKEV